MNEWTFKPALLRTAQTWRLEGNVLRGPSAGIDLARVTRAALVDEKLRNFRFMRLDLTAEGHSLSAAITVPAGTPPDDPDRAQHLALAAAVAGRLAKLQPDLPVVIGEHGRAGWAMFGIGAVSLVFGASIGIAALASGSSGDRLGAAALPVLLMIVLGAVIAWARRPWRPPVTLPAAALPGMLRAYSGGRQASAAASAEAE